MKRLFGSLLILCITLPAITPLAVGQAQNMPDENQCHMVQGTLPATMPPEQMERYERALNELRLVLGFDHPALEEMALNYAAGIDTYLELEIISHEFRNSRYILTISNGLFFHQVYVFRVTGDVPALLPCPIHHAISGVMYFWNGSGFGDVNDNGFPDIVMATGHTGSCCPATIIILEIVETGKVVDITPDAEDVWLTRMEDINLDGLPEIRGIGRNPTPGVGFSESILIRWFGWNGTAYEDISARQAAYYESEIFPLLQRLGTGWSCDFDMDSGRIQIIHQILLDYYAMGRLQEGWEELQPFITTIDRCEQSEDTERLAEVIDVFQSMVEENSVCVSSWLC